MSNDRRKTYCTVDHANKRRELAERSPYQFWLDQVQRGSEGRQDVPAPGADYADGWCDAGDGIPLAGEDSAARRER